MSSDPKSCFGIEQWTLEKCAIAALSAALVLIWIAACFLDINAPAHARLIRALSGVAVLGLGVMEWRRPWTGFKLFFLLWPQGLVFREILAKGLSPSFDAIPTFWGGPLAAALTLAVLFRIPIERKEAALDSGVDRGSQKFRWALWTLALIWVASAVAGSVRLMNPPEGWRLGSGWRQFLTPGMSVWTPLQSAVEVVPALLLGLALLNGSFGVDARKPSSVSTALLKCVCAGLAVAAVELLFCYCMNCHFTFDNTPPSGPFGHRNTTGPLCVLACVAAIWLALRMTSNVLKGLWAVVACLSLFAAYQSLSRNAYALAVCTGILALVYRPSKWRIAALILFALSCLITALWLPLPDREAVPAAVRRVVDSINELRSGEFNNLTAHRGGLWITCWHIFLSFPILGSGPGTFGMIAYPGSPFAGPVSVESGMAAAHSMPLNILAECGPIAAVAWCVVWLFNPLASLVKRTANPWTILALLIGISNLADTVWLVPGMATLASSTAAFSFILVVREDSHEKFVGPDCCTGTGIMSSR